MQDAKRILVKAQTMKLNNTSKLAMMVVCQNKSVTTFIFSNFKIKIILLKIFNLLATILLVYMIILLNKIKSFKSVLYSINIYFEDFISIFLNKAFQRG